MYSLVEIEQNKLSPETSPRKAQLRQQCWNNPYCNSQRECRYINNTELVTGTHKEN